jgi:hydrogenase maturation protease
MDEGIGVRVVEELLKRFRFSEDVEVLDGGTSGIELLSYFTGKDHLIIVDAVKSGHAPGTVVRMEGEDVPATFMVRISPHQLGISDVLAAARLTGELPQQMVLFGMEPKHLETGLDLSEDVRKSLPKLVNVVIEQIRDFGYPVESLS